MGTRIALSLLLLVSVAARSARGADLCEVAGRSENYSGFDAFPKPLKDEIAAYRKQWRSWCGKREAGGVSGLFDAMLALSRKIDPVIRDRDEDFLEALRNRLPAFVPSIRCFLYDGGTNCEASFEQFAEVASKGTMEDKIFAETYRDVRGYDTLPPWLQQTWDYGGCVRYGEYDWVATLKRVDDARQRVNGKTYTDQLNELKHSLLDTFSGDVSRQATCSCKTKTAPLKDLPKIVAYLEKSKDSREFLSQVRELLAGLRAKKFKLLSQAEAHCSGG